MPAPGGRNAPRSSHGTPHCSIPLAWTVRADMVIPARSSSSQPGDPCMRYRLLPILFAAVFLVPARAADLDASRLGAIRTRMDRFVESGQIAGAVTVVGTSKGVARLEAVGKLRLDGPAMPRDAEFRIASMTKPITAVGVMILVDEGKLNVADPVEKYLPEFKGQMLAVKDNKGGTTLKK